MANNWDERYGDGKYIYGEAPNLFFKETIDGLLPGNILLPADGEGRNGVYAAQKGWKVDSFDQSIQAKNKALALAARNGVDISYAIMDFAEIARSYQPAYFDAIALIYVHLPLSVKAEYHKLLPPLLKRGGHIIIEGFSKKHVKYQRENALAGGPPSRDWMYCEEEILSVFGELEIIRLSEREVDLAEGSGHNGKGSVIRFIGRKP